MTAARTFHLEIEIGNDEMRSVLDLRGALTDTARDLAALPDTDNGADYLVGDPRAAGHPVRDRNGNTVGRWYVSEDAEGRSDERSERLAASPVAGPHDGCREFADDRHLDAHNGDDEPPPCGSWRGPARWISVHVTSGAPGLAVRRNGHRLPMRAETDVLRALENQLGGPNDGDSVLIGRTWVDLVDDASASADELACWIARELARNGRQPCCYRDLTDGGAS